MLPLHLLWPFLLATLVFTVMPGPAVLYSAAQTLAHGRRSGLITVLGLHVGGYAYVGATAFGLSALLHYVPALYMTVKLIGAAYLIFLGVGIIRSKSVSGNVSNIEPKSAKNSFRGGLTVELLNPNTAVFFVAFLPQFVDLNGSVPTAVQLLILGTIVNFCFSCADITSVLLASKLSRRLGDFGWGKRLVRIVSGSILIGLGARLASSRT